MFLFNSILNNFLWKRGKENTFDMPIESNVKSENSFRFVSFLSERIPEFGDSISV